MTIAAFLGIGAATGGSGHLDAQSVTTGSSGAGAPDRERGWTSGQYGSITSGTSGIYGTSILNLAWAEGGGSSYYILGIDGAANSWWTTMTIGTKVLTRTAATYSTGLWTWTTTDTITSQAFGNNGTSHTVYFD